MLLMDFMMTNAGPGAAGMHKDRMEMWAMVISNLAWGFFFAVLFGRWTTGITPAQGAARGAIVGLLFSIYIDMAMYSTTTNFTPNTLLADIAAMTVIAAIGSWTVAFILGMGKK